MSRRPITTIFVVIILLNVVNCTWYLKEQKVCDPSGTNWYPYTGFRIHRQYTFGIPVLHHVRLSHCDVGLVDMESYRLTERNTDLEWGKDYCISAEKNHISSHLGRLSRLFDSYIGQDMGSFGSKWCYRMVRRKKYARREMSIYRPNSFVGGLFLCPAPDPYIVNRTVLADYDSTACTNENATPILPLFADDISQQWFEVVRSRRIIQRVPYLYTPNWLDPRYPHRPDTGPTWANELDVNENYNYTTRELIGLSHAKSIVLNTLRKLLSINAQSLPWEQDRLDRAFAKDHRLKTSRQMSKVFKSSWKSLTAGSFWPITLKDFYKLTTSVKLSQQDVKALILKLNSPYERIWFDKESYHHQSVD